MARRCLPGENTLMEYPDPGTLVLIAGIALAGLAVEHHSVPISL